MVMMHLGSGDLRQIQAGGNTQILQATGRRAARTQGAQDGRPSPVVILARHLAAISETAAEAPSAQVIHFQVWMVAFPDKHY